VVRIASRIGYEPREANGADRRITVGANVDYGIRRLAPRNDKNVGGLANWSRDIQPSDRGTGRKISSAYLLSERRVTAASRSPTIFAFLPVSEMRP
jgi:hypothetical protein